VSLWEVYRSACPVCGNSEGNLDCGPYEDEVNPLLRTLHAMVCTSCGKCFDAGPRKLAALYPGGIPL
jgi:uncharacterized protein with PIN domain